MTLRRSSNAGFTLIEVLVSLVILSVMAATAFKGMDSISRAREVAEGKLKRTLRLQSVMTQWDADMASVIDIPTLNVGSAQGQRAFLFNGNYLRFARQVPGGVQVVAWSLRDGRWERWAGPPVTTVGDLDAQWTQADQLKGTEPGTLTMLKGALQWQLYFCTGVSGSACGWGNAQSASGGAAAQPSLPIGVRSVLTLGRGSGFEGVAVRDTFLAAH
jgi:general secretion pathway protein J